jgi:arylsulfatase A-like enzyme/Flp pilus assembly protein TadD
MLIVVFVPVACDRHTDQSASEKPAADATNVLLITLDTTRADRLGCYGDADAKTPALDALAAAGVRFEQAFCQVPLTLPSHTSLLTGTYPPTNGIHVNGAAILGDDLPVLAEAFKARGYRTGAFVSAWVLNAGFGLKRGFDHYDDRVGGGAQAASLYHERAADATCNAALTWLGQQPDVPFFAWVHFFDPHHPYTPPPPFDEMLADPYDGEIAFMDSQVARLTDWLDVNHCGERTLVVVAGDHGEAFEEHGETEHGLFLYNTTMHVPLIVSLPGRLPEGQAVAAGVRLVDVTPTILDLLGWEPLPDAQGQSLRVAIEGGMFESLPAYGESEYARVGFGWASLRSYMTEEWKYIEAPRPELYARTSDPEELDNVAAQNPEVARRLGAELKALHDGMAKRTARSAALDDTELRTLESLGYVGGTPLVDEPDTAQPRRDPKDMVGVYRGLTEAQRLSRQHRYAEVVEILAPLALLSPESDELRATLGEAYLRLGRFVEAERECRAGLRTVPDNASKLVRLGDALVGQNKIDEALECYQRAAAASPNYAPAHNKLGAVYSQKQQIPQAYEHFRRCVEIDPTPNALTNLANVLTQLNGHEESIRLLRRALQIDPRFAPAHQYLWQVLAALQRRDEAIAALRAACRALPDDLSLKRTLAALLASQARDDPAAGDEAIRIATECCESEPDNAQNFDMLGKAHAAVGDFASAIEAASHALSLAQSQGRDELAGRIAGRLQAYQAGQQP